ncbi:hypothetical protein [Scopulibacillus cellulosilyticus]|uniref:Uncharacterized protein n=1 Tax=Scopulibacillus cellulosilyticus TaxID=2665665 RepID=A0ABW2Q2Q0_9BACL
MTKGFYLTDEEKRVICDFIFLPLARRVLENDLNVIKTSNLKFKSVYCSLIEKALQKLSCDLRDVRKAILKLNIKPIYEDTLCYKVICRGWHHHVQIHDMIAAQQVQRKVNYYITGAG